MTDKKAVAWIDVITEADADADLQEAYTSNISSWGGVDHVVKVHSLNVPSMYSHVQLYKTLMYGKSPIRRPEREMIAVVVSSINRCHY